MIMLMIIMMIIIIHIYIYIYKIIIRPCGQFSKAQSGKTGPAPGGFEPPKGILKRQ